MKHKVRQISEKLNAGPGESRLGIKWRLLLFVSAILILGFSGGAYYRISESYQLRVEFLTQRANLIVDTLVQNIRQPLWYLNWDNTTKTVEAVVQLDGVQRVLLVSKDDFSIVRESVELQAQSIKRETLVIKRSINWEDKQLNGSVNLIRLGELTVEISLAEAEQYLKDAIWEAALFYAILVGLVLIVLAQFIHQLTSPLEKIAGYLNYIGSQQDTNKIKSFKVPDTEKDNEIGQLFKSLDVIQHYVIELLDLRKNLENKVSEQTQELIEARDSAQKAAELKSNFMANVTHELRTPLNAVIGLGELLKETNLDTLQKEYVDHIVSSGDSLLVLIGDLLDLALLEKRKLSLTMQPFLLEDLQKGVKLTFEESLKISSNHLHIQENFPKDVWYNGDIRRIKQVIYALVSNANKFTDNGLIELSIELNQINNRENCLRILVKDTGIGISFEDQKHLFTENFTQLDGDLNRQFSGMGTGLSLVSALVDLMNGSIRVESDLNKGACFQVMLPLEAIIQSKRTPSYSGNTQFKSKQSDLKKISGGRHLNILVAEDNPVNRLLLVKIMEQAGYETVDVTNGLEALEAVKKENFDLILMDIQMPEMDGLTAHREIRKLDGNKSKVPIIAVTANALESDKEHYKAEGFDGFMGKPIEPKLLIKEIVELTGANETLSAERIFKENQRRHAKTEQGRAGDVDDILKEEVKEIMSLPVMDNVLWEETANAIGEDVLVELMADVPSEIDKYKLEIVKEVKEKNYEKLKRQSHALKGIASNSGLSRLAKTSSFISSFAAKEEIEMHFVNMLDEIIIESKNELYKRITR